MKTSGYNFQDLEDGNKRADSFIERELSMIEEPKKGRKKKPKYDFDHLFPKPKGEKNMGMNDFGNKDIAFEGLI